MLALGLSGVTLVVVDVLSDEVAIVCGIKVVVVVLVICSVVVVIGVGVVCDVVACVVEVVVADIVCNEELVV